MIGDILIINDKPEIVIAEDIVTTYPEETDAQCRKRQREFLPPSFFRYTAVKARPLFPDELKQWEEGLLG